MEKMNYFLSLIIILVMFNPLFSQEPKEMPDETWITIEGRVVETSEKAFELDYGKGLVTIEMDGWAWYSEVYELLPDDKVTVFGVVDDDLFESTSIEAASVYVKNLNTFYYASHSDEEDVSGPGLLMTYFEDDIQLTGTVTSKIGREFTINTGSRKITVNTSQMLYNPLDDKGYQKIDVGDKVQVTGDMDYDFVEMKQLLAESVVTLHEDKTK